MGRFNGYLDLFVLALFLGFLTIALTRCGGEAFTAGIFVDAGGVETDAVAAAVDAGDADLNRAYLDSSSDGGGDVLEHAPEASDGSPSVGPDAGELPDVGAPPPTDSGPPPPAVCCYWPSPDAGTAANPSMSRGPCQRVVISSTFTSECVIGKACVWVDPHGAGNFGTALPCP